jgi:DNA-binding NarL/FixJ family response regulator
MNNSLLIAEYSEIIRKGLVHIIGSYGLFDRIHEAGGGSDIEAFIKKFEPDVIIINPSLLTSRLLELIGGLKNGEIRIAAVTNGTAGAEAPSGFSEVFFAGDTGAEIKKKIENLVDRLPADRHDETETKLSPREKDVLRLLAKGLSNKEISEQLFISPHTVITHRKNITRKLNIKSVAGLLVYALINEIITVDEMQQD